MKAFGVPSPVRFQIGADGRTVFAFGHENVLTMGGRAWEGGKVLLAPTAIEVWRESLRAIEFLWTGKSEETFLFEVLQANLSLTILVTGLESYAKTRLVEIESEGVAPETGTLFAEFASRAERESGRLSEMEARAKATGQTLFATVASDWRLNFQNVDHIKRAYRAAFGIKIGEIGIPSGTIAEVKRLIEFRHRIAHVSPLFAPLNDDRLLEEEPVIANRQLSDRAVAVFGTFVDMLHKATTTLMRKD